MSNALRLSPKDIEGMDFERWKSILAHVTRARVERVQEKTLSVSQLTPPMGPRSQAPAQEFENWKPYFLLAHRLTEDAGTKTELVLELENDQMPVLPTQDKTVPWS